MKRSNVLWTLLILFVFSFIEWGFVPTAVLGAAPQLVNFQGVLKNGSGNPVKDSAYSVTFAIYDVPTGGTALWTETQTVTTTGGLFNVLLGFSEPLNEFYFSGADRYLGIHLGSDPEMTPRTQLISVPFSFRVATVDGATGGTISGNTSIQSDLTVSGNVGIGTTPSYPLHIRKDLNSSVGLTIENRDPGALSAERISFNDEHGGIAAIQTTDDDRPTEPSTMQIFNNRPSGAISLSTPTTSLLLASSGNVGVGTSSPTKKLEVLGSIKGDTIFSNVLSSNSPLELQAPSGSTRMFISDSPNNNVGIGTTNPQNVLDVKGGAVIGYSYAGVNTAPASGLLVQTQVGIGTTTPVNELDVKGGAAVGFSFAGANAAPFSGLLVEGNVGIGTTSPTEKLHVVGNICATGTIGACSDARFKRDIKPIEGPLDKIEKLRGVTYRWNRDKYPQFAGGDQIGFVAQEVKGVLPEVVSEGSDGTLSVDYGRFSAVLLEAVKEQQKEIKELKAAIVRLQSERR